MFSASLLRPALLIGGDLMIRRLMRIQRGSLIYITLLFAILLVTNIALFLHSLEEISVGVQKQQLIREVFENGVPTAVLVQERFAKEQNDSLNLYLSISYVLNDTYHQKIVQVSPEFFNHARTGELISAKTAVEDTTFIILEAETPAISHIESGIHGDRLLAFLTLMFGVPILMGAIFVSLTELPNIIQEIEPIRHLL